MKLYISRCNGIWHQKCPTYVVKCYVKKRIVVGPYLSTGLIKLLGYFLSHALTTLLGI